eukprot:19106-Heterococcus_DN1.PRE.2
MTRRLERKLCTFVTYAAVISCVAAAAAATIVTVQNPISGNTDPNSNPYKELNQWVNSFIMPGAFLAWAERVFGAYTAHFVIMYVRDLVAATIIYYTTNSLWHLYIYKIKKDQFFPNGKLAQGSIFMYAGLPVFSEWLIEEGMSGLPHVCGTHAQYTPALNNFVHAHLQSTFAEL